MECFVSVCEWEGGVLAIQKYGIQWGCVWHKSLENNATLYRTEKPCRPQNRPKIGEKVNKKLDFGAFWPIFCVTFKRIENWGPVGGRRVLNKSPLSLPVQGDHELALPVRCCEGRCKNRSQEGRELQGSGQRADPGLHSRQRGRAGQKDPGEDVKQSHLWVLNISKTTHPPPIKTAHMA